MRSLRLFVYSVAVDGFLEAADALRVEIMSASSLASGHLDPLPVFTSVASAERYIDKLATTLGLPNRVGCCWAEEPMIRKLKYEDGGNLQCPSLLETGWRVSRVGIFRPRLNGRTSDCVWKFRGASETSRIQKRSDRASGRRPRFTYSSGRAAIGKAHKLEARQRLRISGVPSRKLCLCVKGGVGSRPFRSPESE